MINAIFWLYTIIAFLIVILFPLQVLAICGLAVTIAILQEITK